jgi:CheY-like chemotaxis protein
MPGTAFFAEISQNTVGRTESVIFAKPALISEPEFAFPMLPNEEGSPKRPLRILYADDMRELREVARIALSRDGHLIECVGDGQQALDRVTADPSAYDLVITDHHMPHLNGIELVTRLRALPFNGKVLIFCSELSPAVNETYQKLKVDRILYKPVFPSELRQVLADLFAPLQCS